MGRKGYSARAGHWAHQTGLLLGVAFAKWSNMVGFAKSLRRRKTYNRPIVWCVFVAIGMVCCGESEVVKSSDAGAVESPTTNVSPEMARHLCQLLVDELCTLIPKCTEKTPYKKTPLQCELYVYRTIFPPDITCRNAHDVFSPVDFSICREKVSRWTCDDLRYGTVLVQEKIPPECKQFQFYY